MTGKWKLILHGTTQPNDKELKKIAEAIKNGEREGEFDPVVKFSTFMFSMVKGNKVSPHELHRELDRVGIYPATDFDMEDLAETFNSAFCGEISYIEDERMFAVVSGGKDK